MSYYEGRKPLAGHKEKKEFAKALGKNKVRKLLARSMGRVNLRFVEKTRQNMCVQIGWILQLKWVYLERTRWTR